MSRTKWTGFVSRVLIGAAALAICGCSSSNSTTPVDSGTAPPTHRPVEAGTTVTPEASTSDDGPNAAAPTFDGTSGMECKSNADCDNGAGINVCSNSYSGKLATLDGVGSPQFWPTPLCLVPLPTMAGVGNCDPGDEGNLQFCDSDDPTDPTSPGVCIPLTSPQVAGATNGFCLPHCTFAFDGTAQMGCPGKDTCNALNYLLDTTNNTVQGQGFCQGTCQADADCSALGTGWVCQTDEGVCTEAKKTRTKTIGTACTNSGNGATPIATSDTETGACNCPFSGTSSTAFYCTQSCVIGGTACPSGYLCDALIPGELDFSNQDGGSDIFVMGPTVQNPGLAGYCFAACNPDGGAAPGADGGCPGTSNTPPLSTCIAPDSDAGGTAAGPDCLPPPQP